MDNGHRGSSENLESSEKKTSFIINPAEDRVLYLRKAYLEGQLTVNVEYLAEKMLSFERQLEIVFPDKNRP